MADTACTACADLAAYTEHLETELEIQKRANNHLRETCMESRKSKTVLKNSTEQRDIGIQQFQNEIRQRDTESCDIREPFQSNVAILLQTLLYAFQNENQIQHSLLK